MSDKTLVEQPKQSLCPGAWAIPPSPRMLKNGNDYYTCSVCGEPCEPPVEQPVSGEEELREQLMHAAEWCTAWSWFNLENGVQHKPCPHKEPPDHDYINRSLDGMMEAVHQQLRRQADYEHQALTNVGICAAAPGAAEWTEPVSGKKLYNEEAVQLRLRRQAEEILAAAPEKYEDIPNPPIDEYEVANQYGFNEAIDEYSSVVRKVAGI